jgi:PH (Pleckstrin Homology) domain-containing protein
VTVAVAEGVTVFRPVRARVVVYVCAAAVLVAMVTLAVLLPSGGQHPWGWGSRLGVVACGLVPAYVLHRLASLRLVASPDGVLVVNVIGRRHLDWPEIIGVRLLRDDPWMMLDLSDGQALAVMAVQKSEVEAPGGGVRPARARAHARARPRLRRPAGCARVEPPRVVTPGAAGRGAAW